MHKYFCMNENKSCKPSVSSNVESEALQFAFGERISQVSNGTRENHVEIKKKCQFPFGQRIIPAFPSYQGISWQYSRKLQFSFSQGISELFTSSTGMRISSLIAIRFRSWNKSSIHMVPGNVMLKFKKSFNSLSVMERFNYSHHPKEFHIKKKGSIPFRSGNKSSIPFVPGNIMLK